MVSPDSQAQRARCQAETPLIVLFKFAEPALTPPARRPRPATRRAAQSAGRGGVDVTGPSTTGDAAINDENKVIDKKVKSICKGC
jgi:hypothetical protein